MLNNMNNNYISFDIMIEYGIIVKKIMSYFAFENMMASRIIEYKWILR